MARATAVNTLQFNIGQVVGSALSVLVLSISGPTPAFALNTVSFAGPIVSMYLLRRVPLHDVRPKGGLLGSTRDGLRFVLASQTLLALLAGVALSNGAVEALRTLAPTMSSRALDEPTSSAGVLVTCFSIGATVGLLGFSWVSRRLRPDRVLQMSFLMQAVGLFVLAAAPNLVVAAIGAVPIGVGFALNIPVLSASMQLISPDEMRGRVMSMFSTIHLGLRPRLRPDRRGARLATAGARQCRPARGLPPCRLPPGRPDGPRRAAHGRRPGKPMTRWKGPPNDDERTSVGPVPHRAGQGAPGPQQAGARYGFGRRAAVLSVDNYRAAVGDERLPLLEAVELWPNASGLAGWEALDNIAVLFAHAREAGVPIIHITGMAEEDTGVPGWSSRRGGRAKALRDDEAQRDRHRRRYDIVEQAAPLPGEVVLTKTAPSAFFGTPLVAHLLSQGIDTLIVVGEAVSGCVRATVVDGCSNRLNMIVVEDCVYDRHEATARNEPVRHRPEVRRRHRPGRGAGVPRRRRRRRRGDRARARPRARPRARAPLAQRGDRGRDAGRLARHRARPAAGGERSRARSASTSCPGTSWPEPARRSSTRPAPRWSPASPAPSTSWSPSATATSARATTPG